jgi:S1-C subfamily serine protease
MKSQSSSTASGFLVEGRKIITNAHAISHHTAVQVRNEAGISVLPSHVTAFACVCLMQVRKYGRADKVTARVLAISHDSDLALLTVDDDAFWAGGVEAPRFGGMPSLHDQVIVVGFPTGGDQISVTAGVVSRIDYGQYSYSSREHLIVQVDSAINAGNSGGPVFHGNRVVGVAFQSLDQVGGGTPWPTPPRKLSFYAQADGIGYVIPTPVVKRVLKGVERFGDAGCFFGRVSR